MDQTRVSIPTLENHQLQPFPTNLPEHIHYSFNSYPWKSSIATPLIQRKCLSNIVSIPTLENHQLQLCQRLFIQFCHYVFQFLPLKIINCNNGNPSRLLSFWLVSIPTLENHQLQPPKLNMAGHFSNVSIPTLENHQLQQRNWCWWTSIFVFQFLPLKIINCNFARICGIHIFPRGFNSYPWKSSIATSHTVLNSEWDPRFNSYPWKSSIATASLWIEGCMKCCSFNSYPWKSSIATTARRPGHWIYKCSFNSYPWKSSIATVVDRQMDNVVISFNSYPWKSSIATVPCNGYFLVLSLFAALV